MCVEQLHACVWHIITPGCPRLLLRGLLCTRANVTFTWLAGQPAPALLMPAGRSRGQRAVRMVVQGNCPMPPPPRMHGSSCSLGGADADEMIRTREAHRMFHTDSDPCLGSTEGTAEEVCCLALMRISPEHKRVFDQRLLAKSREHFMSHCPKNPWRPACQRATARRAQCRDRGGNSYIGACVCIRATADHGVVSAEVSSDPQPPGAGTNA